ncbi:MAG TPA: Gldg family protein [Geminicoccaceae bacterium]|nr:Gldg family protein [Geminicoccaceae bacterium]
MALRTPSRGRLTLLGIGLAIVLFLAINLLAGGLLRSTRLDLTEDGLFTLASGTKEVLRSIEEPIDLRFYYSKRLDELGPYFASYANRVDELLTEYQRLSNGKIRIERLDPQPFSPEEDLAVAEGLQGLPVHDDGTLAYFGLSGRNSTDDDQVLPYLAPERGDFLEYDLSKMIYDLSHPEKPVVAVLGDLPLMGGQFNQFNQFDQGRPWLVLDSMFQFFDVRFLGGKRDRIDDDVDIVMLAQPEHLDDATRYAIDQYVMRGGHVLAFIDPFSEAMAGASPAAGGEGDAIGAMAPLLTSWGVSIAPHEVVGDAMAAQRVTARVNGRQAVIQYLPWLALGEANLARGDVVTADLERVTLNSAGAISPTEGATTTLEPLIVSSPQVMAIDDQKLRFAPDPAALIADFAPTGEALTMAARITGPVDSAFPDGPPEGANAELAKEHLAKAKAPLNLILVADTDLLSDHTWVRQQSLLGRDIAVPIANNGDLAINALDSLHGSQGLIGLRGRGLSVRPFEVVEAMTQDAEIKFRAKEQELLGKIKDTQDKIAALQKEEQSSGVIMTSEQQAEIDDFRAEMIGLRQELRGVQRSLRQDVESLATRVKVLNIWTVPILVAVFAVGLALVRRFRAARFAHAHGADLRHGT